MKRNKLVKHPWINLKTIILSEWCKSTYYKVLLVKSSRNKSSSTEITLLLAWQGGENSKGTQRNLGGRWTPWQITFKVSLQKINLSKTHCTLQMYIGNYRTSTPQWYILKDIYWLFGKNSTLICIFKCWFCFETVNKVHLSWTTVLSITYLNCSKEPNLGFLELFLEFINCINLVKLFNFSVPHQ